jgi:hypothetical protein
LCWIKDQYGISGHGRFNYEKKGESYCEKKGESYSFGFFTQRTMLDKLREMGNGKCEYRLGNFLNSSRLSFIAVDVV